MMTGRVQFNEYVKARKINIGEPFARKVGNKWFSLDGKELKTYSVSLSKRKKDLKKSDSK